MKSHQHANRKERTRMLIQAGGLVQKSGILDAFLIESGDDLQDYEKLEKALCLLGFLSECFDKSDFNNDK